MMKPLTDEQAKIALPRQRRFLILISLTIIGFYFLDVGVKDEAQYSGFVVTLGYAEGVTYTLWVVFSWALLRYLQRVYELFGEISADLNVDMDAEDRRLALREAKKRRNELLTQREIGDGHPNVSVYGPISIDPIPDSFDKAGGLTEQFGYYRRTKAGGRKYERLSSQYRWHDQSGNSGESQFNFDMEFSKFKTWRHRLRAATAAAIRLPAFSEHIAPLLLAICAVASPFVSPYFHDANVSDAVPPTATQMYDDSFHQP